MKVRPDPTAADREQRTITNIKWCIILGAVLVSCISLRTLGGYFTRQQERNLPSYNLGIGEAGNKPSLHLTFNAGDDTLAHFLSTHPGMQTELEEAIRQLVLHKPEHPYRSFGKWFQTLNPHPTNNSANVAVFNSVPSLQRRFVALLASLVLNPRYSGAIDAGYKVRMDMLRALQPHHAYLSNHSRVAVLVVRNCTNNLERVVRQHLGLLSPEHWNLHVWHLPSAEVCVDDALVSWVTFKKTSITNVITPSLGRATDQLLTSDYNALLRSPKFWEHIEEERVFIFQLDTMLCRSGVESYTAFDYVGAPWVTGSREFVPNGLGGTGHLSIRSRSASLACAQTVSVDDVLSFRNRLCHQTADLAATSYCAVKDDDRRHFEFEDVFFVHAMLMRNYTLPSRSIATTFAVDFALPPRGTEPLGISRFIHMRPIDCMRTILSSHHTAQAEVYRLVETSVRLSKLQIYS